jgi:predicted dehydrogenase
MERNQIIQVGAGGWGFSWLDIVQASPHWQLAAVVDRDPATLQRALQRAGLSASAGFTTLEAAVEAVDAAAALIVTPPETHAPVALAAAAHGLHCLVEKPIAGSVADAGAMVDAAERHGVALMVSQNYRFRRAAQTVRRLVQSRVIGDIGTVYINFQKAPPFTGFRAEMEQPLITDMAVHHFDQIRGLLGLEPEAVTATSWNPPWTWFKGDAAANVVFRMQCGARVIYTGSWVSRGWQTTWDGDWHIQGSGGEIHWADNRVAILPNDVFTSVFVPGARETEGRIMADLVELAHEDRSASLAEFAQALAAGRVPEPSGRDNMRSLAMVLGARQAAATGETVRIADIVHPAG